MNRREAVVAILVLCGAPLAAFAQAQWSPSKPVRIIVPFPAGGIVDLMARAVSDKLAFGLGQPVIVEARPGAMGSIGTDAAARSEPDGHTILLATLTHVTLPSFTKTPWHPAEDFAGIAMLGQVPNLAVVPASLEPKTLRELVDYAKARPGKLNYENAGNGTSQTLTIEMLKKSAGIELQGIGYKGHPAAIPDIINGQIHFALMPFGVAAPHVKSGKLRALAVAAPSRNKQFPDVPTMTEAGFPDLEVISWYAFVAPAATPKVATQRLNTEIARALADPNVLSRIDRVGGEALPAGTPAEVDAMLARETERWARFIKEAELKIE